MARDDTREMNLLDQYWNAAPADRRYMSDEPDEGLRQAVDRFEAADDAPDPDPAFVNRLWQDLVGEPLTRATATTGPTWSENSDDERTEPQYIPTDQRERLRSRQQSAWRRRAWQFGEMVAAAVVLVLVTGGLILAYQNLIGEGGESPAQPGPPDDAVPSLSPIGAIEQHGEILDGAELGSVAIGQHDGQDYAFMLTFPPREGDIEPSPTLQVLRLDPGGEHETVGTLALDVPWSGPMQFNMGEMAIVDDVLYAPIPSQEQPGIWTLDISNPEETAHVGFIDVADDLPLTVAGSDDVLVATGMFGNILFFVDISDPEAPELASQLEFSAAVEIPSLEVDGDRLYVAHPRGLSILDIADPANPVEISLAENTEWEGPGQTGGGQFDGLIRADAFHGVVVSDGYAVVAAGAHGVLVFDVSDPAAPETVNRIERDARRYRLAPFDRYVYALSVSEDEEEWERPVWTWSIDALDVSDSAQPQTLDHLPDIAGEEEHGDFLMLSIRQIVAGQDYVMAFGRGGAFVTHIDWVEATEEVSEVTPTPTPEPTLTPTPEPTPTNSEAEVRNLVEGFGEQLSYVGLTAPEEQVAESMQEYYVDYVAQQLIEEWLANPSEAPGRLTSSPWPDRIEIDEIQRVSEGSYRVTGRIIEITSVEVIEGGAAAEHGIEMDVEYIDDRWLITAASIVEPTSTPEEETVPANLTVEEIYQLVDENLRRDGMIYHATITTDADEDSFQQGGSTEHWIDADRGVAREESIAHLQFEETNVTMETSGIIAEGAHYTLFEGPESRLDGGRARTCYGTSESVSVVLGCPGALERSTTTVERGDYQSQSAVILVTTGTSRGSDETFDFTNRLYLDPESVLPIAEETEGSHTYGPVNTRSVYQHEFIDRDSVPADHFDPVSLALTRLDRADPEITVYWLGTHFDPPGDLPSLVLFDGGEPDVPAAGYDLLLSYRLPDPTFASSQTIRSEVVIEEWSRDDWEVGPASEFETHWEARCHETVNVPLEHGQTTIFMGYGESMSPTQPGYNAPPMPTDTDPTECHDTPFTRFEAVAEFDDAVLFVSIPSESEYQSREAFEAVLRGLQVR